jgi:hypothetical protein
MKYAITTFCAAALVVVSGCGGGDDGDGDDDPVDYTTAYAISSVVYDGDDATTYVALIGSLDAAEVDYDRALELPGRASIATFGGKLFVGGGDAPIIRRYVIEADGSFTADGTVSFANYGLTGALYIDDWGLNFIDAQKAYLTNSSDLTIVWDPTALAITGEIETPELLRAAPLSANSSPAVLRDGKLFRAVGWRDWTSYTTSPEQYLAVFDTATDTLEATVREERCPALDNRIEVAEDGTLYFSNWIYNVTETLGRGAPKSCSLRVLPGATTFDPAWQLTFSDVAEGREGAGLSYLGDGKGFLTVFHHERVTIDAETDLLALAQTPNWRLWSVDLAARTAAPVEGADWTSGGYSRIELDGRTFILLPSSDYGSTQSYEVTAAGVTPHLALRGFNYQVVKVR